MMQRKIEKLPGLSSVSGKYTKKCPTDSFSNTSITEKTQLDTYSATPLSDNSVRARAEKIQFSHRQPSTNSLNRNTGISSDGPQVHHGSHFSNPFLHSSSALSSPSWPTSLSSANLESRMLTTVSSKPVGSTRRFSRNAEMVKSSSSGSVTGLNQKPTGIILATPSNQPSNLKPVSRFRYDSKDGTQHPADMVKNQGPSTPYPVRHKQFNLDSRAHTDNPSGEKHSSNSRDFGDPTSHLRPSLTVRPLHKIHQQLSCASSVGHETQIADSESGLSEADEEFEKPSHINNRRHPMLSSRRISFDRIQTGVSTVKGLKSVEGRHSSSLGIDSNTSVKYTPRYGRASPAFPTTSAESDVCSTHSRTAIGYRNYPPTTDTSSSECQQQLISTAPGREHGETDSESKALPGPQYTQIALETYLSELLAEDPTSECDKNVNDSNFLNSLHFLHHRIENALRDIQLHATVTKPNSSASLGYSTFETGDSVTGRDSEHLQLQKSILDQFSADELCYLLKAVQELISLRSHLRPPSGSFGHRTSPLLQRAANKPSDIRSQRMEPVEHLVGSHANSRSSSRIRVSEECVETSASDSHQASASTSQIGPDSSATDIMHKRLPLGFQHFKRYLDDKFGPDHKAHEKHHQARRQSTRGLTDQHTMSVQTLDTSGHTADTTRPAQVPRPDACLHSISAQTLSGIRQRDTSLTSPHGSVEIPASTSRGVCSSRSLDGVNRDASRSEQAYAVPPSHQPTGSRGAVNLLESGFSGEQILGYNPAAEHQPEHSGYPIPPNHQRSYCSTPEVVDSSFHGRLPYTHQAHYWYPLYSSLLQPGQHYAAHNTRPSVPSSATSYMFYPFLENCSCGSEHYRPMYYPAQWSQPRTYHVGSPTGQKFRYPDPTAFGFASPEFYPGHMSSCMSPVDESMLAAVENSQCSSGWNCAACNLRPPNLPFPFRNFSRFLPLATSPAYDSPLWSSNAPNPRFPYYHSGPFSPCYSRMPRSGSAGAGFGCGLDSNLSGPMFSPQYLPHDNSFGPEHAMHESIPDEQQQQQPSFRSTHQFHNLRHVGGAIVPSVGTNWSSAPRPMMSNSLSVNDLSGYRTKLPPRTIRPSRSSFELTPDLPCEPKLSFSGCSAFYAKLAVFIEIDNSLQLSVPNGWCERRSSMGRSYYACDETKQAIWHHPTFGLLVPLGWERVDSCQNGVFYQNLLIPHCQRYHPNLWIPGPLKDPAVEHENFFSDLRYLQSSMRRNLSACSPDLETYKHTDSLVQERTFLLHFQSLDVESMVEVTRGLDQLFYKELHALVVFYEQERMRIVSAMFSFDQCESILSCPTGGGG